MDKQGDELSTGLTAGLRYLPWIFGFVLLAFLMLVILVVVANLGGELTNVQLAERLGALLIAGVGAFAVFWRLTTPPLPPPLPPPPAVSGPSPTAPGPDWGEAQVLATMIYGQDNTTWLAFSLAMTTEVLLLVGFFTMKLENFRWVLAVAGILVGLIFRNMVLRSNGDLRILYNKTEGKHFRDTFYLPPHCRKGVSAGLTMDVALWGWVIAWLIAIGALLIDVIR